VDGWLLLTRLALNTAIAVGADCCFLPERPPPMNPDRYGKDWAKEMCDIIKVNRMKGNRKSLVIVCEGAIDVDLNHISPDDVKKILENNLHLDTRVTTLGHVQRGGSPCAFDRYLGTVQGIEAVESVLRSTKETPAPMIGMRNNKIISVPLMDAVKLTKEVSESIKKKDFKHAMELRDPDFNSSYNAYIESSLFASDEVLGANAAKDPKKKKRIGVIHVGAPAGGMNAATRVLVRLCLTRGHTPVAIKNGFTGLINNEVEEFQWEDVRGWQTTGGTQLGTNRSHPSLTTLINSFECPKDVDSFVDSGKIAYCLQKHEIDCLVVVGGFEAFSSVLCLSELRCMYPALCIPIIQIPATISNNVPATDYSLGSDTALNVIVQACDSIRLSANASRKRVFCIEVHGGNCGYLATLSGLNVGATAVYIPEETLTLKTLSQDVEYMKSRYQEESEKGFVNEGRVILRSQNCKPKCYSTKFISDMLQHEGKGCFDSRESVLGHLQQGDVPSPLDRIRATRMAVFAIDFFEQLCAESTDVDFMGKMASGRETRSAVIVGIQGADLVATPISAAKLMANMELRTVTDNWWMPLMKTIRVLGKRDLKK
jgi:6-phosphofructokinase 1